MNLSGKWKIRAKANDVTGKVSYRTSIAQKNLNGETEFYTVFLNLVMDAKNKPIDDNSYIIVKPKDAWLGFNRKSETDTLIIANVKDFQYAGEGMEVNAVDLDDDLPF